MSHDPDPERLKALEERLDALKGREKKVSGGMGGVGGGELAWRMVLELVTGMGLGLGLGYGLDSLFGTKPVLMIIFVLLGFAAGIRTMLRTASELGKKAGGDPDNEMRD
ncbi:AtpZ/AtpI family protein [Falsigemmobacter intermedius]|uniref:ATP synthase protein I n=1 Tax=Falsigemmobacter intermedius TaxID=1553448 RepID=A0A444MEC3_9RHOB|nr:AtpZ/AtpI family protein [Falsigemmobacter intermedius]RWY43253.1 AtpZ/AtpI family protein [Falsigemmobacter intermedius]